jgi:hypothetical protein
MSFTDLIGDVGGGFSDAASWLGNQVGDAASWVGNQLGLTGGGSTPSVGPTNTPAPTTGGGAASTFGGSSSQNNAFLNGGQPGSSTSAISGDLSYTAGGPSPTGSTGAGASTPGTQSPATKSIMQTLGLDKTSPVGALAGAGGLAYNLISGSPSTSAEKQIKNIAGAQSAQGQQLEGYLANGTLPPGAQQWVDNQTQAQSAAIRAKYANLGLSGSSAETQELNQVQANATSQIFTIASQLLDTGINETNASGQLYNYLMQAQNSDAKDVSSAIQNFVASLGGGGSAGGNNFKISAV